MSRSLILAAMFFITATALSQTVHLKATIPFSFVVNQRVLPAGDYSVESFDEKLSVLSIRSLDSSAAALAVSHFCGEGHAGKQSLLVFHRYGNRNYLKQIWIDGVPGWHELTTSPYDKRLAKNRVFEKVEVVARR